MKNRRDVGDGDFLIRGTPRELRVLVLLVVLVGLEPGHVCKSAAYHIDILSSTGPSIPANGARVLLLELGPMAPDIKTAPGAGGGAGAGAGTPSPHPHNGGGQQSSLAGKKCPFAPQSTAASAAGSRSVPCSRTRELRRDYLCVCRCDVMNQHGSSVLTTEGIEW